MPLRSVLIIDDSEFDRYMLRHQLLEQNITTHVTELENGQAAIEFLSTNTHEGPFPPELIFVDANMPIMDGGEFLKRFNPIKENSPQLQSSILIMFTSSDYSEEERQEKYGLANGHITKMPSCGTELKEKIMPFFSETL